VRSARKIQHLGVRVGALKGRDGRTWLGWTVLAAIAGLVGGLSAECIPAMI
jgi:hypothetical protein